RAYVVSDVDHDASGKGYVVRRVSLGATVDAETWAEFIGYMVSEGSVYDGAQRSLHMLTLTQMEGETAERIESCLRRLPFHWNSRRDSQRPRMVRWRCFSKALWAHLKEHIGIGARQKRIPRYLLSAPRNVLQRLFDALIAGDGSTPTHTGHTLYCTRSPSL